MNEPSHSERDSWCRPKNGKRMKISVSSDGANTPAKKKVRISKKESTGKASHQHCEFWPSLLSDCQMTSAPRDHWVPPKSNSESVKNRTLWNDMCCLHRTTLEETSLRCQRKRKCECPNYTVQDVIPALFHFCRLSP